MIGRLDFFGLIEESYNPALAAEPAAHHIPSAAGGGRGGAGPNYSSRRPPKRVLTRRRTAVGGVIVVLAAVVAISLLTVFWVSIAIDNSQSDVFALPTTLSDPLKSDYEFRFHFIGYRGGCVVGPSPAYGAIAPCDGGALGLTVEQITGIPSRTCSVPASHECLVVVACQNCTIPTGAATVGIGNSDPNTFALAYNWSASSVDYHGEPSTISGVITAPLRTMFKGTPTTVSVTANPAQLTSYDSGFGGGETDANALNGVLMRFGGVAPGPVVSTELFELGAGGPALMIQVNGVSSTISVKITSKLSNISIFAQTLAILSGAVNGAMLLSLIVHKLRARGAPDGASTAKSTPYSSVAVVDDGIGSVASPPTDRLAVPLLPSSHVVASESQALPPVQSGDNL